MNPSSPSTSSVVADRRDPCASQPAAAADVAAPKRVWIVDDDEIVLLLAEEVLAAERFRVECYSEPARALEALDAGPPDIVVLDLMMPGMDGFEFCRRLRAHPIGRSLPVLMATALDDHGSINRAYEAGATDFTVKPVNWTIEAHRLRYLLRSADVARDLQDQVAAKERAYAELKSVQQELIEASHMAGMAEVATGVLHNVGNVLNSINVSTTVLRDNLRHSKILVLAKVAALLKEHSSDLGVFLTTDPKGRLVPEFLIQLADHLQKEHGALQQEYDQLSANVEHIKSIVTMQQNYAKVSGFREKVSMVRLLEDALHLCAPSLARHGIQIERRYSEIPEVMTEKHRVLQILVNLVRNALLALKESAREDKVLTVGVEPDGSNGVRVFVSDNGIGIPAENISRIFSYGFTTRKGGHGFGLHNGANAAKELGGRLGGRSDGPGLGATFVLELPVAAEATG
ncbi:MAG: response regulator [Verrucomicrobiales bacterium]|nr:response regulator [Verrucomicrobiales bacterium]